MVKIHSSHATFGAASTLSCQSQVIISFMLLCRVYKFANKKA
ncbi:hypothetical protein PROSTU_00248 [Providencia stuartii ATCC 25827]|uniref:Uncharacterized protein n=1 Tax=Providencia stuartii ATCC 25827 TaxID=471874 RepID=A0AA87CT82_PROST|nr:hypothetical protein PROSTU_00248 [Providencia stuartii ATCC 25827]